MVCGDSGYMINRQFLELAYYDEKYRPSLDGEIRWLTVQDDALSERGWRPTHWTYINKNFFPTVEETSRK